MAPSPSPRRVVSHVDSTLDGLLAALRTDQRRALGRLVSVVEEGGEARRRIISTIYPKTGRARVVGITGPPGAGKSTLVDRLAHLCRSRQETVGILAVDPSSPFSGGALLGDRVRMQSLSVDPGVFIRSMATRGAMGGVARSTRDAVDLLDGAGFDWVLVETVGVGQDEVDIIRTVDTVLVVTVPGLGDEIQTIKAGIMEIADIFVVNKADRDGADRTVGDLESMLTLAEAGERRDPVRRPALVRTVATRDQGTGALLDEIEGHQRWLAESGELERRRFRHLRRRVETILQDRILTTTHQVLDLEQELRQAFKERQDPYSLADRLFAGVLRDTQEKGKKHD